MPCLHSVAVQDVSLSRGCVHGLSSSAFAGSAFLATEVPSDLPFGGTELADYSEIKFILLISSGMQMADCCLVIFIICIWSLTTKHDKITLTCDVVGDTAT